MERKEEWWETIVRQTVAPFPMRHPTTGNLGEWRGRYLAEGERTDKGYETDEDWHEFCQQHHLAQPCHICEAAALGDDEGAEA